MTKYNDMFKFTIDKSVVKTVDITVNIDNLGYEFATTSRIQEGTIDAYYKTTTKDLYDVQKTLSLSPSASYTIPLTGIPWHFDGGTIEIQYQIGQEGPFDVTWDATLNMPPMPEDAIKSDNSDVELEYIAEHTTLIQRFNIDANKIKETQQETFDDGTITITATSNSGDTVINNVITKPVIRYYEDFPTDAILDINTTTERAYYYYPKNQYKIWHYYAVSNIDPDNIGEGTIGVYQFSAIEFSGNINNVYKGTLGKWIMNNANYLVWMGMIEDVTRDYDPSSHNITVYNKTLDPYKSYEMPVNPHILLSYPFTYNVAVFKTDFNHEKNYSSNDPLILNRVCKFLPRPHQDITLPVGYIPASELFNYMSDNIVNAYGPWKFGQTPSVFGEVFELLYITNDWPLFMQGSWADARMWFRIAAWQDYMPSSYLFHEFTDSTFYGGGEDIELAEYYIKLNSNELSRWIKVENGTSLHFDTIDPEPYLSSATTDTIYDISEFPTLPVTMLRVGDEINSVSYDINATCEFNLIITYDIFKDTAVY